MDLLLISSMNSYIKNLNMENKWQQKKADGNFTSEEKLTKLQQKNESFKKSYAQQKDDDDNELMTSINNKVAAGTKLTEDEMKYLKVKNPMLYQKLRAVETEKKVYERELRQCKTKDEVQKLKASKVNAALSTINSVKNNPNISDDAKLSIASAEMSRLSALEKVEQKFVQSGEYGDLPTEQERLKAEQEIQEAQQSEETADVSENPEGVESTENFDTDEEKISLADNKLSKSEAEQTPEAQKVKHSKAKAVYETAMGNFESKSIG